MSHNALIHAGGWAPGYVVTQADFVAIDTLLFKSINGDDGGTWAPAATITIGGAGLTLTSALVATSGNFSSSIYVGGSFTAAVGATHLSTTALVGKVTFSGGADFTGGASYEVKSGSRIFMDSGSEMTFHRDSLITADCNIDIGDGGTARAITIASNVTVTFAGGALITSATPWLVQSGAKIEINGGTLEITGAGGTTLQIDHGARVNKGKLDLNNANQTIDVTDGPVFIVPGISANRDYSIQNTSATTGDEMEFYCINTSNDGIVKDQSGNVLANMRQVTTGKANYLRVRYNGSAWVIAALSCNP